MAKDGWSIGFSCSEGRGPPDTIQSTQDQGYYYESTPVNIVWPPVVKLLSTLASLNPGKTEGTPHLFGLQVSVWDFLQYFQEIHRFCFVLFLSCCLVAEFCLTLFEIVAHQAPLSMPFPRQEYWSGLPFPSPEDLPHSGIKPTSPALAGGFFTIEPPGKPVVFNT